MSGCNIPGVDWIWNIRPCWLSEPTILSSVLPSSIPWTSTEFTPVTVPLMKTTSSILTLPFLEYIDKPVETSSGWPSCTIDCLLAERRYILPGISTCLWVKVATEAGEPSFIALIFTKADSVVSVVFSNTNCILPIPTLSFTLFMASNASRIPCPAIGSGLPVWSSTACCNVKTSVIAA